MILPSLYNPNTVASQNGSTSLILSLICLFIMGGASLAALFNPLVVFALLGGFCTMRVLYAMFKGE
jgi:hypothetical protein